MISWLSEPMTADFVDGISAGVVICVIVLSVLWGFAAVMKKLEQQP